MPGYISKDEIVEKLIELNIEHDPTATREELWALVPDDAFDVIGGEDEGEEHAGPILILKHNCNGHQVGETFTAEQARAAGFEEADCEIFHG